MQILTKQSIILQSILYYRCQTTNEKVWDIINHVDTHVETIGFKKRGQIITSMENTKQSTSVNLDILIPIDSSFEENEQFSFLPHFKLIHAVKIRHEGNINNLSNTQKILEKYLEDNSYEPITKYYNVIVRHNSDILANSIIDIYVGINPNILN